MNLKKTYRSLAAQWLMIRVVSSTFRVWEAINCLFLGKFPVLGIEKYADTAGPAPVAVYNLSQDVSAEQSGCHKLPPFIGLAQSKERKETKERMHRIPLRIHVGWQKKIFLFTWYFGKQPNQMPQQNLYRVLSAYCDTGYCDKLLIVAVFVIHKRSPKWQFYTVKSSVIVTFAYCDTFLWSQQCHNKREATYHNGVSNQLCIHFARLTLKGFGCCYPPPRPFDKSFVRVCSSPLSFWNDQPLFSGLVVIL